MFGFSNYFYGSSGRDIYYPEYNTTEVQTSAAGSVLTKYGNLSEGRYSKLRKQANIEFLCDAVVQNKTQKVEMCDNRFCLFNIIDDPCELEDLSSTYPDILNRLLQKVKRFNMTVVPISDDAYKSDPRAHPKYWNNYWTPWLDNVSDPHVSSQSSCFMSVNVSLLLLLIVTHLLFIVS